MHGDAQMTPQYSEEERIRKINETTESLRQTALKLKETNELLNQMNTQIEKNTNTHSPLPYEDHQKLQMNLQYSEKELKLIEQLGYMDLPSVKPIVLYRIMAMNLFKQNETGVLVDSVRRCLNAIDKGAPYRLTEEFDELIVLDD